MVPAKWEKALAALLESATIRDAAAKCGASERTLRRWLADPAFLDAYRAAAETVYRRCLATLSIGASEAGETLRDCLHAPRPADRIAAARALLDGTHKARELCDLEARLAALEAAAASKNGNGHATPIGCNGRV